MLIFHWFYKGFLPGTHWRNRRIPGRRGEVTSKFFLEDSGNSCFALFLQVIFQFLLEEKLKTSIFAWISNVFDNFP